MPTLSPDGSHAVPISGPSERLALLRVLWLKAAGVARGAWHRTTVTVYGPVFLPRWAGSAIVSILSSDAGYNAAVNALATTVGAVWRSVAWVMRTLRDALQTVAWATARALAQFWPTAAGWKGNTKRFTGLVTDRTGRLASMLTTSAVTGEGLLRTTLVRTVATWAAKIGASILTLHGLSQGMVAAKIVAAVPASMSLVVAVTNPWIILVGIGLVTLTAMGVARARLLHPTPHPDPEPGPAVAPLHTMPAHEDGAADALTDLAEIAKWIHVKVEVDGSVVVEGIPATVPPDLHEVVAQIAADAAVRRMQRTLRVRPAPSRDDRRLFTKAAREALVAAAKSYGRQPAAA